MLQVQPWFATALNNCRSRLLPLWCNNNGQFLLDCPSQRLTSSRALQTCKSLIAPQRYQPRSRWNGHEREVLALSVQGGRRGERRSRGRCWSSGDAVLRVNPPDVLCVLRGGRGREENVWKSTRENFTVVRLDIQDVFCAKRPGQGVCAAIRHYALTAAKVCVESATPFQQSRSGSSTASFRKGQLHEIFQTLPFYDVHYVSHLPKNANQKYLVRHWWKGLPQTHIVYALKSSG